MVSMNRMNIYVGNISTTVSEDQLRDLFSQFGQVTSVKLIKDKFTGDARGFAFVEMASNEEGLNAISKANGVELSGQRLRVNEARPREERPARR
jgi:RNA recognition motif-containing protein